MSVRGADGKKLNSMGKSFVYMKAPASPSWKRVEVVITKTGENFLLSHANLKNLNLLSEDFPEYLGQRRRGFARSVQEEDELVSRPDNHGSHHPTLSLDKVNSVETDGDEILVSQCESAITMELPEELSDEQAIEAEAYAVLYVLGGYTYNNVVHEVPEKHCNSAKNGEAEMDDDLEDEEGINKTEKDVDEEALI